MFIKLISKLSAILFTGNIYGSRKLGKWIWIVVKTYLIGQTNKWKKKKTWGENCFLTLEGWTCWIANFLYGGIHCNAEFWINHARFWQHRKMREGNVRGLLALSAYPSSSTAGTRQVNTHTTYVNPSWIE